MENIRIQDDLYHFINGETIEKLVIPDDKPETFAAAVIKLYTDKEFYAACAENARRLSEEVNWENEFARLIEFEKKIVAEK